MDVLLVAGVVASEALVGFEVDRIDPRIALQRIEGLAASLGGMLVAHKSLERST